MGTHRIAVVNGMFFDSKTMSDATARRIVALLPADTDIVSVCEMGKSIRSTFEKALDEKRGGKWSRKGARDGMGYEGVNGVYWNRSSFDFVKERHKVLASGGQWPRFLVQVRLTEKHDPNAWVSAGALHLAAKGGNLSATAADRVKWTQSHQFAEFSGNRRAIWGGDFPRTGDDDDMKYLAKEGFTFHGRTDRTPLTVITKGAVKVVDTDIIESGRLLDHDLVTSKFTIPNPKPAPNPA